ncbi:MAG: hypothetical protein V3S08_00635 [Phycisphaerales bacterium]
MTAPPRTRRSRRILRIILWVVALSTTGLVGGLYGFNNVALMSGDQFDRRLDDAIKRATGWIRTNQGEIASTKNVAMYMLLQDCHEIHPEPLLAELVDQYLAGSITPDCWRRVLDRGHPVDRAALNRTIADEMMDNRWMLYAIAPEKGRLDAEDLEGLFDPDRWSGRHLTHQLMALVRLREDGAASPQCEQTIEKLCTRIAAQLRLDIAVVDLYIQKIAVVLDAGHAELIDRRWVERVIENQSRDGGWNDRWCRVFTSFRRPALDLADPPSNQHATIQALWLLYQVKYRR